MHAEQIVKMRIDRPLMAAISLLMVATSGGYATAAAIGGARLVILPGMGHDFPPGLVDTLVSLIVGHARSSQCSAG